eukprot:TRINITY_DN10267_c0_g1_i6.p2 TRINITY_DN10267_c0_g1~~TRINITY_DN10267_c0_g1_i6.p2  ORF type:complete len:267 (-),score=8.30 TRINITY_DN10267_c0_g1_i6:435-1160(-)
MITQLQSKKISNVHSQQEYQKVNQKVIKSHGLNTPQCLPLISRQIQPRKKQLYSQNATLENEFASNSNLDNFAQVQPSSISSDQLANYHNNNNNLLFASTMISIMQVRRMQPILRGFRNPHLRGPMSVFFLLWVIISAIKSFVVHIISDKTLACSKCHGFGIERCDLCSGSGFVNWEGKFQHLEPCPLCCSKRYVRCTQCGGFYHRQLFKHARYGKDVEARKPATGMRFDWDRRAYEKYAD